MRLRIGGATVNQIPLDWKNNTTNIINAINEARNHHIHILCLPELCITGYGCEDIFLSEWLARKAFEEVLIIKEHCENITVSVGLPVRIDNVTYNGACVISNKKILGITCKQFLARDGVHYEPRWFTPWISNTTITHQIDDYIFQVGDLIYEVEGIKFGFEICEDAWHKSNRPGHRLQKRGVHLILNPSASHFAMGKSKIRESELVIEGSSKFECAYVFANLSGNEAGRMIYDGDIIIGQNGYLLAVDTRLSFFRYKVLSAEIDFQNPVTAALDNLHVGKYGNEELTQAVSLALFDYLIKSKAKGYVLSLSGGADSSACAVFVAEMVKRASAELGIKKFCELVGIDPVSDWKLAVGRLLTCAYQGTKNSSYKTFQAAKDLAQSIGAKFHYWTIDDEVTSYTQKIEQAIGRPLIWETDDVTMQNIQARSRSPIIWMLANVKRAVLLTTSNRSEGDVGYATMDGDTSGSLAPIAGLSKVFILQWLKWAEVALAHKGLHAVNNLQPTAELRPLERHQTDESDLMPYAVLVEIEKHAIYHKRPPLEVFDQMQHQYHRALLKVYIKKFFTLWCANQWKRERLAPSFHLDDFNVDPRTWCRFPILSSGFATELQLLEENR